MKLTLEHWNRFLDGKMDFYCTRCDTKLEARRDQSVADEPANGAFCPKCNENKIKISININHNSHIIEEVLNLYVKIKREPVYKMDTGWTVDPITRKKISYGYARELTKEEYDEYDRKNAKVSYPRWGQ